MAEALTNTRGPSMALAASRASSRVGPTRLWYISRLWPAVNLPAIGTPARWTMASVPARISGSGFSGSQALSSDPPGARRTSRMTRWPPVDRNATSAEPTSPPEPVMATVRGVGLSSRAQLWAERSAAS